MQDAKGFRKRWGRQRCTTITHLNLKEKVSPENARRYEERYKNGLRRLNSPGWKCALSVLGDMFQNAPAAERHLFIEFLCAELASRGMDIAPVVNTDPSNAGE